MKKIREKINEVNSLGFDTIVLSFERLPIVSEIEFFKVNLVWNNIKNEILFGIIDNQAPIFKI